MRPVRRKREGELGRIQMAPMIDIVFQLLIFFLVASEVRPVEAQFRAELPADGKGPRPPKPQEFDLYRVSLRSVDADGRAVEVSINREVIGRDGEGFRQLSERLGRLPNKEKVRIVIEGDAAVRTQFVTDTLDCAADAQIRNITFSERPL